MGILKHPVSWGSAATVSVGLFALWIGSAEHCFHDGACVSKFQLFLQADPNEVGDTLAGFAGALAFVWIIVTVWLQSNELAAQREELKLTRLEMAEQRKATQDMARAMAAQASVLEDEQRQRENALASSLLERKLEGLRNYIQDQTDDLGWWWLQKPDPFVVAQLRADVLFERREETQSLPIDDFFRQQYLHAKHLTEYLISNLSSLDQSKLPSPESAVELYEMIISIKELEARLAEDQIERLRNLGICGLSTLLEELKDEPVWNEIWPKSGE